MIYNPNCPGGGIEAEFKGPEVETVRRAFVENAERLKSLGNYSSVSNYQKWVTGWRGYSQTYKGPSHMQLIEPLCYFVEVTQEKVDELLDTRSQATRIQAAAKRYELGYNARVILEEIEQSQNGETIGSID